MMLRITGNSNRKHLLKRRILRNMLGIKICAIHGVISHSFHTHINDARIGQLNLFVHVGLILNDEDKITNKSRILMISDVTSSTL